MQVSWMNVKATNGGRTTERTVPTTCIYWLAGRCSRNPCRFLHSKTPSSYTSCNAANTNANTAAYHNSRKRHSSSSRVLHTADDINTTATATCHYAKKRNSSYVYERPVPKHNIKTVLNKKIGGDGGDDKKDSAQLIEAASLPKHNTETVLKNKTESEDNAQVAKVSQNLSSPTPSICKYWMNDSCVHGEQCRNLHSWFYGDGFAELAKLQGHKKLITGMAIPDGSDKLYTGSSDGALRTWNCHTGQCVNVTDFGTEVTSLFCKSPWIFVGLPNTVMAYNIQTSSQYALDGPTGQVLAMTVGKDSDGNNILLAGSENGVIFAWRDSSEANSPFKLVASLHGHTKSVVCLAIGCVTTLFSGSKDQSIKVWDLNTFECKMTLNAHKDAVTSLLCWENYLLSGSSDCTIKVWFLTEAGNLEVTYSHNVENGVVALAGMADPELKPILFCSTTTNNSVHLYDLPSFAERGRLFAKQEIGLVDIGPGGLFFTGDKTGLLTVWKWLGEYKKLPLES